MLTIGSISRQMTLGGLRRLQLDDCLMLLALCFYTTLMVTINIVRHTNSNLFPPGYDVNHLSQADIRERRYGSKLILVVEECQICNIWLCKACLLIMYLRLTALRKENLAIKVLSGYVAFAFVWMQVFYLGVWCRPFSNYWAVPTPNTQCDAATNHLITNAVFNLSSDVCMIAIGLPMFLWMNLPLRKKIPLVGIFSLGVFVILAAILNKVYSFTMPFGAMWTYWYVRESSTALLVANLPFVWTFWKWIAGGSRSIDGVSGHMSNDLSIAISRGEKQTSSSRASKQRRPSFPWSAYSPSSKSEQGDMELGMRWKGRRSAGLTLHEILSESNPDLTDGEEITPYTHPALFFTRQAQARSQEQIGKFVGNESATRDVLRQDSGPEHAVEGTPASSILPRSIENVKTAKSAV